LRANVGKQDQWFRGVCGIEFKRTAKEGTKSLN
jgi:hypothetical protein